MVLAELAMGGAVGALTQFKGGRREGETPKQGGERADTPTRRPNMNGKHTGKRQG